MTGLSPENDRVIEVAVVVTDAQCAVRAEGPVFAIHQSDAVLDGMDAWNKGTHGKSGLIDRVKASTVDEAHASAEVIAFFHYRNLDVSTLKELARRWKPSALEGVKKAQAHTALADVHESIDELLHYRLHLLAV
jgi:oligoribonuclease